jgi:hypothetical protein
MNRVLTIAALVLVVSTRFLWAQVQTPMRVTPFGGVQEPLAPTPVPPELKAFIPSGFTLRAVINAKMSPSGEKLILYDNDNGEDSFPGVRLHALQNGKDLGMFEGRVAGFAGMLPIGQPSGRQLLAFAYHKGFDQSDTMFEIFSYESGSYSSIFRWHSTEGRMRVLSASPLRFEIWTAATELDPDIPEESCVWCPHRYHVITYELKNDNFDVLAMRTTQKRLVPDDIASKPFVMSQRAEPGGRPR